jgi:hypothetical protein
MVDRDALERHVAIVSVTVSILNDRKVAVRSGRWRPATDRAGLTVPISTDLPFASAINVAERAIASTGARGVEVLDDRAVVGWVGSLGNQYQIAIDVTRQPDGGTVLAFLARPRFATTLGGSRRSATLVATLREYVGRVAGPG